MSGKRPRDGEPSFCELRPAEGGPFLSRMDGRLDPRRARNGAAMEPQWSRRRDGLQFDVPVEDRPCCDGGAKCQENSLPQTDPSHRLGGAKCQENIWKAGKTALRVSSSEGESAGCGGGSAGSGWHLMTPKSPTPAGGKYVGKSADGTWRNWYTNRGFVRGWPMTFQDFWRLNRGVQNVRKCPRDGGALRWMKPVAGNGDRFW